MKKKMLLCLFFVSCISTKELSVTKIERSDNYKKPRKILFVFKGDTHSIYFFKDLAYKLEKDLSKQNINVAFNYNLFSNNPLKENLKDLPKKKFYYKDFNVFMLISIHNVIHPKRTYDLNFEMKDSESLDTLLKGTFNLGYFRTILEPSKNSSLKLTEVIIN